MDSFWWLRQDKVSRIVSAFKCWSMMGASDAIQDNGVFSMFLVFLLFVYNTFALQYPKESAKIVRLHTRNLVYHSTKHCKNAISVFTLPVPFSHYLNEKLYPKISRLFITFIFRQSTIGGVPNQNCDMPVCVVFDVTITCNASQVSSEVKVWQTVEEWMVYIPGKMPGDKWRIRKE